MTSKYDLAQSNYHATPGHILLLKSARSGALNRTGQRIKRRHKARFTHVAVDVDATKGRPLIGGVAQTIRPAAARASQPASMQ